MIIRVSNIHDFIGFIHNAIHNGEEFPRVLHSSNPTHSPVSFDGPKDHVEFTYALFTTKLNVLFTGLTKTEEFTEIDKRIKEYRFTEGSFRIQLFRSIKYDSNELYVEGELDAI